MTKAKAGKLKSAKNKKRSQKVEVHDLDAKGADLKGGSTATSGLGGSATLMNAVNRNSSGSGSG